MFWCWLTRESNRTSRKGLNVYTLNLFDGTYSKWRHNPPNQAGEESLFNIEKEGGLGSTLGVGVLANIYNKESEKELGRVQFQHFLRVKETERIKGPTKGEHLSA